MATNFEPGGPRGTVDVSIRRHCKGDWSAAVRDCGFIIPARGSEAIMAPAQNRRRRYERHIR